MIYVLSDLLTHRSAFALVLVKSWTRVYWRASSCGVCLWMEVLKTLAKSMLSNAGPKGEFPDLSHASRRLELFISGTHTRLRATVVPINTWLSGEEPYYYLLTLYNMM